MELNEFKKRQFMLIAMSSIAITWIICFSFNLRDVGHIFFIFAVDSIFIFPLLLDFTAIPMITASTIKTITAQIIKFFAQIFGFFVAHFV